MNKTLHGIMLAGLCFALAGCGETPSPTPPAPAPPKGLVEMVAVPAGEFVMGDDTEIDCRPPHHVAVDAFQISKHEIAQDVYEAVMENNPSRNKNPRHPVERVRWLDAIKFCNALSRKEGLKPCYNLESRVCDFGAGGYRLPTEAEWEYACRAGGKGDFAFGADAAKLKAHGWFKGNAREATHPVGRLQPNAFGLRDMAGNVREWCNDWYRVDSYRKRGGGAASVKNPHGPEAGEKKVLRGGSWSTSAESCTSWARYCDEPGFTDACVVQDDCGFRIARNAQPAAE